MANHSEWVAFFHPIRQESNESFKGENPEDPITDWKPKGSIWK